jgi:hypothetical protein
MPALVNRVVGSSGGTKGAGGINWWLRGEACQNFKKLSLILSLVMPYFNKGLPDFKKTFFFICLALLVNFLVKRFLAKFNLITVSAEPSARSNSSA